MFDFIARGDLLAAAAAAPQYTLVLARYGASPYLFLDHIGTFGGKLLDFLVVLH
jgi:hypothetical protein